MQDKENFEKSKEIDTESKIPTGDIRKEREQFSVFKLIKGKKTFLGIKKTEKEAIKLWELHK